MMKQATMEMWYGFRQRMKTPGSWFMLALFAFVCWLYHKEEMEDLAIAFFSFSFILGTYLGYFSGANTGKLSMILPITPTEYKWLIYAKSFWVLLANIICFTVVVISNGIGAVRCMELFFTIMIPSLLFSNLIFIRNILPIRDADAKKGYAFPLLYTILGMLFTYFLCMSNDSNFHISVKLIFCILSYVFLILACRKLDKDVFNQVIYYDEVEKEAGKVHW